MNQIERDRTPAPPLIEITKERDINTFVFDIDGTVLDTRNHFRDILFRLGLEMTNNYLEDIDDLSSEQIALDLEKVVYEIYYANKKHPVLIGKQFTQALNLYLKDEANFQVTEEMKTLINNYQEICYGTAPKIYGGTEKVLRLLLDWNIDIVFNSHAQDGWTGIKVSSMEDVIKPANSFPYVTTPLHRKKGMESWLQSCRSVNTKPENTVAVGDNFEADILSAMLAGYKNLVWVNSSGKKFPRDLQIPEDTHLYVIEDISQLENLNEEHRTYLF